MLLVGLFRWNGGGEGGGVPDRGGVEGARGREGGEGERRRARRSLRSLVKDGAGIFRIK